MQNFFLAHLTVVTYGGGEVLTKIFQALAMLFNGGHEGLVRPLMVICASLGGFYAVTKALFSGAYEGLVVHYFFPLLVLGSLFLVPTTTLQIEDVLTRVTAEGKQRTSYTVSHVPLLLAHFAKTVSSIGYHLSEKIESKMHLPNDPSYNATGMIFGSEAALDMTRYQLTNANLEQNLRLFSKQCVLYDIALGRYSLDDLKKTTDLWTFFEEKTSQVRMIRYCPLERGSEAEQCSYATCKEAISHMKPFFEKEKEHYAKLEIGRNLPLTFQALTGLQKANTEMLSKELVGQQLTLNVLTDVLSKGGFAKKRAYEQQQSTYRTMGTLAANGLVTMRIVFEALIYASFVFILPLSLLPGGWKYLSNWAWLAAWIQLWPPFYTILNYIMLLAARSKFGGWFHGLALDQQGLSLFTSIGLQNLGDEVFALAGFLGASVPYLSYILLKGGLSSFVQLASSLSAPAQGAAASAAAEQTAGNYSFANTSFGQTSFGNTSAFQTQMAPSVSSGYFVDHRGDMTTTYQTGSAPLMNQNSSNLRTGVMSDASIGQSFQTQKQDAQSYLENVTDNYMTSIGLCTRQASDWIQHVGESTSASENISSREDYAAQQSANYLQSLAKDWGQHYGLGTKESLELLTSASGSMGVGISFLTLASAEAKVGESLNFAKGASRDEVISAAQQLAEREDFQHHFQKVQDYAQNQSFQSANDQSQHMSKVYCDSLDQLKNQQKSYQSAQQRLEQVSQNEAWFTQNSHLIKRSLNDDFIKWANHKVEGGYSQVQALLARDQAEEIQPLIQDFIQEIRQSTSQDKQLFSSLPSIPTFQHFNHHLHSQGDQVLTEVQGEGIKIIEKLEKPLMESYEKKIALQQVDVSQKYQEAKNSYSDQAQEIQTHIHSSQKESKINRQETNDQVLFTRAWKGPNKNFELKNSFKTQEAPFWMQGEE